MTQLYPVKSLRPKVQIRPSQRVGSDEFQRVLIDDFVKEVMGRAEILRVNLRTDMTYVSAKHLLPAHAEWMERQWQEKLVNAVLSAIAPDLSEPEKEAEQ